MFSSLCSGRRWQESLEDLRPSRAGAPPDPGIQAAYPCRGRERIEDLCPSRPGPPPDLGIHERPSSRNSKKARTLNKKFPAGTPYFACGSQPDILHKRTSRASENTMSPNMVLAFPPKKCFYFSKRSTSILYGCRVLFSSPELLKVPYSYSICSFLFPGWIVFGRVSQL